jgi:transposase
MSDLPDELPSDPAELRAFAAALLERCARLERLLKLAKDAQFGRSSEKLDADQLQLVLEDIDGAVAALEAAEDRADPKTRERRAAERRANRGKLPEHLPRIVEILLPAETCCPCCEGVLFEIGSDESQRLDVVPAQYRVIVTRRPKLACRACHGVVLQHAAPERLIRGGLPTERLVAHVIDAKYHWHLPLYRQAQMLATHGIAIDRSTLAFWVGYAAQELKPLWRRLREILLASAKLCVDETPVPVLDPGRGKTKTGYFWALSRDDRPWAGPGCVDAGIDNYPTIPANDDHHLSARGWSSNRWLDRSSRDDPYKAGWPALSGNLLGIERASPCHQQRTRYAMASCCRRYRARRFQALGHDPQLLVIPPVPPATSLDHLKPFKLSTALMAVHNDCYRSIALNQQDGTHRRETVSLTNEQAERRLALYWRHISRVLAAFGHRRGSRAAQLKT